MKLMCSCKPSVPCNIQYCVPNESSDIEPIYQNSSKIIQSMYAMNPNVYIVSSQDFVDSIATNLYVP